MASASHTYTSLARIVLALLGAGFALAIWILADNWDSGVIPPRVFLPAFAFTAVFSVVSLALIGPISIGRALGGGAAFALAVAALASVAGLRFDQATDLLDDPVSLSIAGVLVVFATPFLSVWLHDRSKWLRYPALFSAAWGIFARYFAGWAFVGAFWLVVFFSDTLLDLVDIDVIERFWSIDWVRYALTGAVLGLGLAVLYELRGTLSPFVILRLLRLLIPVVLAVVAVFLGAVPFRGLSHLFGEFSAAATLMGAAIVAISLISIALDRTDDDAVSTRGLRLATRVLALLLPCLTALAVWAVFLRVRQYGWTPDRVLAAAVSVFLLAYAIAYFVAALRGAGWAGRIRSANVALALGVIVVCVLWLTPVLDANRISANSQVARFERSEATPDELPLWLMAHDWGRAGADGLARLQAVSDAPGLMARIEQARAHPSQFLFDQAVHEMQMPELARDLADLMPVRPEGARIADGLFTSDTSFWITLWLDACRSSLPDGRPGCALVVADFAPSQNEVWQGMVLYRDETGRTRANHVLLPPDGSARITEAFDPVAGRWPTLTEAALEQVLDGDFTIAPSGSNAIYLGGAVLAPGY